MKTKEQNRLIAEFMGIRNEDGKSSHESSEYFFEDCELEYHFSWDWLMPVVEKLRNTHDFVLANRPSEKPPYKYPTQSGKNIIEGLVTQNIDKCYGGVVEFINWYNQQKQD